MQDTGHEKNTGQFVTYSHPAANCQTANGYYWKWIHLSDVLPQYHKDCQDAKAEYQLHLWDCDKCTALIQKCSNYVKDGLDEIR